MIGTIGVVVPAVDEQATIGRCLDALDGARRRLHEVAPRKVNVRVVVVLDSCVDQTATIVRGHRGVDSVECTIGCAGGARRAGARWMLANTQLSAAELWLANTDADSVVPRDWLVAQFEEADAGAHLVLGTVVPEVGLAAITERAWRDNHLQREGHPHVHGANLGIRADVYAALGGWPGLATGEDVALVERAASGGHLRITRTARIPVRTSARLRGRAPHGFASYLCALLASQHELAV